MDDTDQVRWWSNVLPTEGCWHWTASTNGVGYGKMWLRGRLQYVHRISYEMFKGEIPEGLELDHLCRNRSCVNPDHLEPVTSRTNLLRGTGPSARNSRKQFCPRGHQLSPRRKRVHGEWVAVRYCKECKNAARRVLKEV